MTRINLYPWRLELQERKIRVFFVSIAVSLAVTLLFNISQSIYFSRQIAKQKNNIDYIKKEIARTNLQLRAVSQIRSQKDTILARLSVLQKLDTKRYSTIHLLNEIVNIINPLVVLREISRKGDEIQLAGFSESNSGVAKLLRDIELSPHFSAAELKEIKVLGKKNSDLDEKGLGHSFKMRFIQIIDDTSVKRGKDA